MKPGDLARMKIMGGRIATVLITRPDEVNQERGEPWWHVLLDGREILVHEKFLERVSAIPDSPEGNM